MHTRVIEHVLKKRIDKVTKECFGLTDNYYISGGTIRRLFMIENEIPMSDTDKALSLVSDIDVFFKNDTPTISIRQYSSLFGDYEVQYIGKPIDGSFEDLMEYDIECCSYYYSIEEGKIKSLRKSDDFFSTSINLDIASPKTLERAFKYYGFGFKFPESDMYALLNKVKNNEDMFNFMYEIVDHGDDDLY